MSDDRIKISELPIATAIEDNDYMVLSNTTPVTDVDDTQHGTRIIEARTFNDSVIGAEVDLFDSTESYSYDAIVYYEGKVYYNGTGDHISAGSFDDTKWTEITLSELIKRTHFDLANPYIEVEDYYEGDIVVHDYWLYQCNTDETTGTWDDTKWDGVTLASLVNALKNDLATETSARESADTALNTKATQLKADLADEYDSSSTYNVGDVCTHDFKLYRCLNSSVTGTWDGTKWEETTVDELINDGDSVKDVQSYGSSLVDSTTKVANLDALTAVGKISRSAIATFTDGSALPMPKLEIAVEPQQDLHGYDAPWVGGAGKNKLPDTLPSNTINAIFDNTNVISQATNARVFAIPCKSNTNYVASNNVRSAWSLALSENLPTVGGSVLYQGSMANRDLLSFNSGSYSYILVCVESVSIFNNLAINKSMIEEGTSATSYLPYSNICPISGWDEVNVTRTGKNLFDKDSMVSGLYDDATFTVIQSSSTIYKSFKRFLKAGTYTFSASKEIRILRSVIDGVYSSTQSDLPKTFTLTKDGVVGFSFRNKDDSDWDVSTNCQIEEGNTATTYEPYNGHTYTIDLDGTRYGGTLDVVSGVMTVEKGIVDLGNLTYTYDSVYRRFASSAITNLKRVDVRTLFMTSTCYSCMWHNESISDIPDCSFYNSNNESNIYIHDSRFDNATDLKNALSGQKVVYPLATPLTIQLTPTAVSSLLGVNNIWADTGDVIDASYIRDLTPFLDKILYKDLYATLSANATSLTITDDSITTDSTFDFFTDTYGVSPQTVSVSNGSMTMTFTARNVATKVKVRVML